MDEGADPLFCDVPGRILKARSKPSRTIVGLMSGTSCDSVDAALVEITGSGPSTTVEVRAYVESSFTPELHHELLQASELRAGELSSLNFRLGEEFARAAKAVMAEARTTHVDLVASHGHTVFHEPRGPARSTLQLGEAAVIAERLGVAVVSDFRVRDVAAGGEGAPLVPLADWILFRKPDQTLAMQNIGGISNVTLVTPRLEDVFAFDNAPGNMELDLVALAASGGEEPFDRDGARGARGRVDEHLLAELHAHPYFALPPPKSTGREAFGQRLVQPLLTRYEARLDDLLATLTRFVAEAIRESFRRFVEPRALPCELIVSGGGVNNTTLMRALREAFAPLKVRSMSELGIDPAAKEAVAFAVLGNEAIFARAGNLPAATGASGSRVLGKLVL